MTTPFREAEIDLDALTANVARFRELTEGAPLFVDVGADAWGHGFAVVVPALAELGAQAFVVARAEEARTVRALAADPLIVTTQHPPGDDFSWAAELGVAPTVRTAEELDRAVAAGVQGVMLAADMGEGFPGFAPDALDAAVAAAAARDVPAIIDSAFPVIGAELFGVSELGVDQAESFAPVMRFWAPIALTKRVGADEGVSYGYTYRTPSETTLALITLGYGDGLTRAAGNRAQASVDGVAHPLAGRVAMDATVLDLGDIPAPPIGTAAVIFGDPHRGEPTVQGHAETLGTHSAEITTRLTKRVHRSGKAGAQ